MEMAFSLYHVRERNLREFRSRDFHARARAWYTKCEPLLLSAIIVSARVA